MQAASKAASKTDATRFRRKCQELIAYAEKIKSTLPKAPQPAGFDILQGSSRLHDNEFPPWDKDPQDQEFQLSPSQKMFEYVYPFMPTCKKPRINKPRDPAAFRLSPTQAENFSAWSRPHELFQTESDNEMDSLMTAMQSCNLVQDVTTDCSVVASLSAALEVLTGKHSVRNTEVLFPQLTSNTVQVLSSIIYPFDHGNNRPKLSPSGKYVFRMNFNGCSRKVVIDDRLPASRTDRTLFVVDRRNPHLIWPALLEKAYLKVRGGYDFPGSNSGTDLWVLIGWIPEQIFLQREDFDLNETWDRIKSAHDSQDVVVTLGTGRISAEEEEVMGLVGEHDYAVLDLDSSSGIRRLLIKNPWCNGPVWTGAGWATPQHSPNIGSDAGSTNAADDVDSKVEPLPSGTLWVALEDVAQHFESMYLNWNPSLFHHRQDVHFRWSTPPSYLSSSLIRNKQFSLSSPTAGPIWILVSRHFLDAELDIMRNKTGSLASVAQQLGYMSILIFNNEGHRVQISNDSIYSGPYVDSPQTLARLDAKPNTKYTIVLDQQQLPLPKYSFTLSVFSPSSPVTLHEASEPMSHFAEQTGAWNRRTAGGNSSCPTYFINPQYKLTVPRSASSPAPVSILLATDSSDIHVHVDLIWASGKRATSIRLKDLAGTSGEYRQGCAVANIPNLEPGTYTLACSTFEAGQTATFYVRASSTVPITLEPVAADAAGRLRQTLPPLHIAEREEKRRAPISVSWLTRSYVCVRSALARDAEYGGRISSSLMVRVSVVHGWGPQQVVIAESGHGEFEEPTTMVRTPDFDIEPERVSREGMWLVIETIGIHHANGAIESDVFSDSPVQVGAWEVC